MKYFILFAFCFLFISGSVFASNYKTALKPKYKTILSWNNGQCRGTSYDKYYPCPPQMG